MIGNYSIGNATIGNSGSSRIFVVVSLILKRSVDVYAASSLILKRNLLNTVNTTLTFKRDVYSIISSSLTLLRQIGIYLQVSRQNSLSYTKEDQVSGDIYTKVE